MAYYNSYPGENYQIPLDYSSYDIVPHDYVSAFSTAYDETTVSDPHCFAYNPMSYNYYTPFSSDHQPCFASISYSAYASSEHYHVVDDPNCYYSTFNQIPPDAISKTKIYYSVSEFNEIDFEEYDPTPYGGGYDIYATYGKPLPPSEKTCYPRSSSLDPTNPPSLSNVPIDSVDPLPEKEKVQGLVGFISEPTNETKPTPAIEENKKQQQEEEEEEEEEEDEQDEVEEEEEEEEEEDQSSSGSDHKLEKREPEQGRAVYVPSGYGLEAMDLCETIFGGYFPCLLRNRRHDEQSNQEVSCCERNDGDPWMKTSDYLFGNLNPYGDDENYDGRTYSTEAFYGYQRHYLQEHPMSQIQRVEW